MSTRRVIVAAAAVCLACRSTPPQPPAPDPVAAPDSAPPPVVVPEGVVAGRVSAEERARRLVAEGRALVERPGGVAAAVEKFQDAIGIDSLHSDAYWELGWAHQRRGEWTQALRRWRTLGRIDPWYPGLARHMPILEMRSDRAAVRDTLAPDAPLTPEEEPRDGTPIRIAAVGDIQLGRSWPEDDPVLPPDNAAPLFRRVGPWLRAADITFGNLETVLADTGRSTKCRRGSRNCYAFRAPTDYAGTLRRVGFDVLSVNNNHAGDFGEYGRWATVQALERHRLRPAGPTSGVAAWETLGLRVALIAFSTGSGPYRVQDVAAARREVILADRTHDLVIVSFHGGAEGSRATRIPKARETAFGEDRGDVYAFARAMVDAGADLVLGHGPHVLRGMEIYRGRLIAYSLGNFSAWHGFNLTGPLGVSAVLNVTLAINGVVTAAEINPVFLDDPGIPTPDPERRAVAIVRRLSRDDLGSALFDENGRYRRGR